MLPELYNRIVLLVDDDRISNFISAKTIERSGLADEIITATSGIEALDIIRQSVGSDKFPGMIFLDINMPEMSGWDFIHEYRKVVNDQHQERNIVILTSSIHENDRLTSLKYPEVYSFILKPLTMEEIRKTFPDEFFPK